MSVPFDAGTGVPLAVLGASLLGSAHCAVMCGPLSTVAAEGVPASTAYHLARLAGYASLGAAAGWLGRTAFDPRWGVAAAWLASAALAAALIALGLRAWRGEPASFGAPLLFSSLARRAASAAGRGSIAFAASCGVLTALLPCGWLHSFVLGAAATRSPGAGALVMVLFWLGTVPALTAGAAALKRGLGLAGARAPRLAGALLVGAGLAVVAQRGWRAWSKSVGACPICAERGTVR